VSFDVETTVLEPLQAEIVGLSFAIAPGRACYVPVGHRYTGAPDQLDRARVLADVAPWLADAQPRKIGQNLKFDEHVLANHGLKLAGVAHDTLLESYVLESHKPHDMDNLAWRHLDIKTLTYDEVTGKGAKRIPFEQVAVERGGEYAAEDADVTLRLHAHLYPQIERDDEAAPRLRDDRAAGARRAVPHGAHGVLIDGAARRRTAARSASACWRSSSRRSRSRARRSTSARRSSCARSCSSA
jgi:DNA polymerase-1